MEGYKDFSFNRTDVNNYIKKGQIFQAITLLKNTLLYSNMSREKVLLEEIETNYSYLVEYLEKGVKDLEREKIVRNTQIKLIELSDYLYREAQKGVSSKKYYTTIKILDSYSFMPLELLLDSIKDLSKDLDKRESYDNSINIFFKLLWTSFTISSEDLKHISESSEYVRLVASSALTLSVLQFWNLEKVKFMIRELEREDCSKKYRVRILFGLFLIFNHHKDRLKLYQDDLALLFDVLVSTPDYKLIISEIWDRYYRSYNTLQICTDIEEKILQDSNLIKESIKDLSFDTIEDSPIFDVAQSSMSNVLREPDADFMYLSLKEARKNLFFSEISSWFLPFDDKHSSLSQESIEDVRRMLNFLRQKFSNVDLYAFVLSVANGSLLVKMFDESMGEEEPKEVESLSLEVKRYLEDFYRFIKDYNLENNITIDFFAKDFSFQVLPGFTEVEQEQMCLDSISYFYSSKRYSKIRSLYFSEYKTYANPEILSMLAYSCLNEGKYKDALSIFKHLELIDELSFSTKKTLIYTYMKLREYDAAILVCDLLLDEEPENYELIFQLALIFIEKKEYERALEYLYRYDCGVEVSKAPHYIAWLLLLLGKYEESMDYYKNLCKEDNPMSNDFLNAAYVAIALGEESLALEFLKKSIIRYKDVFNIYSDIEKDLPLLSHIASISKVYFLVDAAISLNKKENN